MPPASPVTPIKLSNRFGSLKFHNNETDVINYDDDDLQPASLYKGVAHSSPSNNSKRPPVVIDNYPERQRTMKPDRRIVPGEKLYSAAHLDTNNISIVTDSMTNRIRARPFNNELGSIDGNHPNAIFCKFPGATSSQINWYSAHTVNLDNPKKLIIVAGTNDLAYHFQVHDKYNSEDVRCIGNSILNIARNARCSGVSDIHVCSIIYRRGQIYEQFRKDINLFIRLKCLEEGFYYVDNDNINYKDLWKDGLHLNDSGTQKLKNNLLQCCSQRYNPYLC